MKKVARASDTCKHDAFPFALLLVPFPRTLLCKTDFPYFEKKQLIVNIWLIMPSDMSTDISFKIPCLFIKFFSLFRTFQECATFSNTWNGPIIVQQLVLKKCVNILQKTRKKTIIRSLCFKVL